MSDPAVVPMFDSNGVLRDVPYAQMKEFQSRGGTIGVKFSDPDGNIRYAPPDKVPEISQHGGKILPMQEQSAPKSIPGFLANLGSAMANRVGVPMSPGDVSEAGQALGSDVAGIVKGAPKMAMDALKHSAGLGYADDAKRIMQQAQTFKEQGAGPNPYSPAYRILSPLAENLGINVQGMQQSATQGSPGGVMGHAATVPAVMAATEGLAKGIGFAGDMASGARGAIVDPVAKGAITKLIKPTAGDLKFGRDPAGAVIKEGITANSLEDLGPKVYEKAREVGQQIDQALQGPSAQGKIIDVKQALKPIDDGMVKALQNGEKAVYDRLRDLKQQLTQTWAEDGETGSIKPSGPKNLQLSPLEATKFKRQVGDMTRWTGTDPFETDINAVKADIFSNVKNLVNQAVPEVGPLNQRYADLVSAGKAVERRIPVAARNPEFSLGDIASGGVALHAGGPAAVGVVAGRKILSSTAFKTRAAQALSSQANIYPQP